MMQIWNNPAKIIWPTVTKPTHASIYGIISTLSTFGVVSFIQGPHGSLCNKIEGMIQDMLLCSLLLFNLHTLGDFKFRVGVEFDVGSGVDLISTFGFILSDLIISLVPNINTDITINADAN